MHSVVGLQNRINQLTTQFVQKAEKKAKREIFAAQQQWAEEVAPWYPMDYDNIEAVDFFLVAVRNHRAVTSESTVLTPHLARKDTIPANNADASAVTSQSCTTGLRKIELANALIMVTAPLRWESDGVSLSLVLPATSCRSTVFGCTLCPTEQSCSA